MIKNNNHKRRIPTCQLVNLLTLIFEELKISEGPKAFRTIFLRS